MLIATGLLALLALAALVMVFLLARDKTNQIRRTATAEAEAEAAREGEAAARAELAMAAASLKELEQRAASLQQQAHEAAAALDKATALHQQQERAMQLAHEERERLLNDRLKELNESAQQVFKNLAGDTLKAATDQFIKQADQRLKAQEEKSSLEYKQRSESFNQLLKPISETLGKTQERLLKLDERVALSAQSSDNLREETQKLARALSRPEVRGGYGEIQLRRVAELAGLANYCDFSEQHSTRDAEGRLLRPDMIVNLPNDRQIVVDAKCNIDAYLQATRTDHAEEQERHLAHFASTVAKQAKALGAKRYWSQYDGSPEFVVMFIPGDHFIDAALSRQPELLEHAATNGVILASPSTLIGLLRAVHVGWREHRLAEEAHELLEAGRELHRRAATAFEHVNQLGKALNNAVGHYNKFVGSTDRMLMPQLRKFEEMDMQSSKQLTMASPIEQTTRELEAEVTVKPATPQARQLASKAGKAQP